MDGVDIERAFQDARRQLESIRADAEAMRGEGEAADGRVRVITARGRLEQVELDPRAMRMPGEQLAEHLVTAGNAALDELRAKAPASREAPHAATVARHLQEVTADGLRSLTLITQAIEDAMARVGDRAGMSGDPRPTGLEELVERTRRMVPEPPECDGDEPPGDIGTGEAADGRIRARVASGGRIEALEIDASALRLPSVDVAEQARTAINRALDDLWSKAQRGTVAAVDPQRLQELREDSVRQLTAHVTALRDLIASVYR